MNFRIFNSTNKQHVNIKTYIPLAHSRKLRHNKWQLCQREEKQHEFVWDWTWFSSQHWCLLEKYSYPRLKLKTQENLFSSALWFQRLNKKTLDTSCSKEKSWTRNFYKFFFQIGINSYDISHVWYSYRIIVVNNCGKWINNIHNSCPGKAMIGIQTE